MNTLTIKEILDEIEELVSGMEFERIVMEMCRKNGLDPEKPNDYARTVNKLLKNNRLPLQNNVSGGNNQHDMLLKRNSSTEVTCAERRAEYNEEQMVERCDFLYKRIARIGESGLLGGFWSKMAKKIDNRGEFKPMRRSEPRIRIGNPMLSWDEEPEEGVKDMLVASQRLFYDVKKDRTIPLDVMMCGDKVMLPWDIIKRIREGTLIDLQDRRR